MPCLLCLVYGDGNIYIDCPCEVEIFALKTGLKHTKMIKIILGCICNYKISLICMVTNDMLKSLMYYLKIEYCCICPENIEIGFSSVNRIHINSFEYLATYGVVKIKRYGNI